MKPLLIAIASAYLLTACAAKPIQMQFNPLTQYPNTPLYQGQNYRVEVNDQRREPHLLKVITVTNDTSTHKAVAAVVPNLTQSLNKASNTKA